MAGDTMEFLIIIIVISVIIFLLIKAFLPLIRRKNLIKSLTNFLNHLGISYKLTIIKHDKYDLSLNINNKTYFIKLLLIPDNATIQINSKTTWELLYGGGANIGSVHSSSRHLSEIIPFLAQDYDAKKNRPA